MVFVVIPVHNRLTHTRRVIECLKLQTYESVEIIVVDDGSTDGTSEFLETIQDIRFIRGSGNLWWAGSTKAGIDNILDELRTSDYILLLNNDVLVGADYISQLVAASISMGNAAIGSVVYGPMKDSAVESWGVEFDRKTFEVRDIKLIANENNMNRLVGCYEVGLLSGRGTLYPAKLFLSGENFRPKLLPHYFADYEISLRFKNLGKLYVCSNARVYSQERHGHNLGDIGFFNRMFSIRSGRNILHTTTFYLMISPRRRWPLILGFMSFFFAGEMYSYMRKKCRQ